MSHRLGLVLTMVQTRSLSMPKDKSEAGHCARSSLLWPATRVEVCPSQGLSMNQRKLISLAIHS